MNVTYAEIWPWISALFNTRALPNPDLVDGEVVQLPSRSMRERGRPLSRLQEGEGILICSAERVVFSGKSQYPWSPLYRTGGELCKEGRKEAADLRIGEAGDVGFSTSSIPILDGAGRLDAAELLYLGDHPLDGPLADAPP